MESKLMPCKVADLIDVIISHNERVGIWVEYRNGDESGCALLWKGMAHELPRQHLNSRFVRIFGLIPETIMDADIINIIVEIPTPMTTSEPTTHEFASYECQECGFSGDVEIVNKTVTCPECGTVNDVWLLGETPPPNHREEPTTGEIVRALRCIADDIECKDCRYKYPVGNVILCDHEQMNRNAADRLESQEQTIEQLNTELAGNVEEFTELTARAEQAERERDFFIDKIRGRCAECKHEHLYSYVEPCESCHNANGHPNWEWRGLPQEGEWL